jgi:hypothetical protein
MDLKQHASEPRLGAHHGNRHLARLRSTRVDQSHPAIAVRARTDAPPLTLARD